MSQELTTSREHLTRNRRMIIGRALAASVAGAVPIPILEEWLSSTVERGTIKRIAESHGVDLSDEALKAIADGPAQPPSWAEVAGGGIAWRLFSQTWRRLLIAVVATRRAQAATKSFAVATAFDHYCARMHVGLGLDGVSGAELRALIDKARKDTPGGIGRTMFRRGAAATVRAALRAPMQVADFASGGWFGKLLASGDEVDAAVEVENALEKQLKEDKGPLGRAVASIEMQLAAEGNPFIDELLDNFERSWRQHTDEDDPEVVNASADDNSDGGAPPDDSDG